MPGFSINEFKSTIGKRGGIARANKFLLTFALPEVLLGTAQSSDLARDVEFWCDGVNLPGYQLATMGVRRWTFGPEEKRPIAPIFQPIQATFLADGEGAYFKFFNAWMHWTMPHDWYRGSIAQQSLFGGRQYELEYKSKYATDLMIQMFDIAGEPIETIYVKEAFPSQVADIPLNWNDGGNARFSVTFDFLDWVSKDSIQE